MIGSDIFIVGLNDLKDLLVIDDGNNYQMVLRRKRLV